MSFLTGHVAYIAACTTASPIVDWSLLPLIPLAAAGLATARWLWPHLGLRRMSVSAYVVVISVMVWGAIAAVAAGSLPGRFAVGAVFFYLSDLAVARHRFVRSEFINRVLGLPAYYAGQILIALSI
jgi:uncharacterized membrane protein YhhN